MSIPDFDYEKKLIVSGFNKICGVDEVGRGPLAGPVVACAVIIDSSLIKNFKPGDRWSKIRDSKKLSARQREMWYDFLTECPKIRWATGLVSEKTIDEINILEATKLAMEKALKKINIDFSRDVYVLIDGNFILEKINLNQKAIPQGDEKIISVAAASIIAKVTRDRIMERYGIEYPVYDFKKHKGYGTKKHIEAINKFGPCLIHRRSFEPIKSWRKKQ